MKSCGPCSLKTGCYLVALYTFILGILLLSFNGHDLYYYGNSYHQWGNITSFVFAVCLFFAAICLFLGLRNNGNALVGVWTIIFLIYVVVQIAYIIYNIYEYTRYGVPEGLRPSVLGNIIVFSILIAVNITCFVAVRSYRGGSGININI